MEYRWITEIDRFRDIASEWDESLVISGEDNPFLLSDFILTWWKYFNRARKLMIFAGYDNGRLVSGIPLCIAKKRVRDILGYVGAQAANLTHYFSAKEDVNFMGHLLSSLKENRKWDILILERVLESNGIINQCRALNSKALRCDIRNAGFDGLIDLSRGYDSVLGNLSERLRRYVQSGKKKALLMGELKLSRISGSQGVKRIFSEFRDMSIRSFRARGGFSAFENLNYSDFFAELFEALDKKEMLDVHRLSAGDNTLAISFGYRFGKGFKWILTAFNQDFSELRPGHILIDALVQESITRGDPYFDMYYGGEVFYKQQWCNRMLSLKKVTVYRSNVLNRLYLGLENGLKSTPLFMLPAKRIRNFITLKRLNANKNG